MQLPPWARSRVALGLTAAAAEGRFELQVCTRCGRTQYPPREACHACLADDLDWREQTGTRRVDRGNVAAAQPRPLLSRAPAVATRHGATRLRADRDRAPAWRRATAPGTSASRRATRQSRDGRPDRLSCTGDSSHGRRSPVTRNDLRPQVPQSADHRRTDRGRAGPGQGIHSGRRRSHLAGPGRGVEGTPGSRMRWRRCRRSRSCRST